MNMTYKEESMFTLIRNARVFTPSPIGINDVLLCGQCIAAIGPSLSLAAHQVPGVKIIDATGLTMVPGLIDQHVHVAGGGGENGFTSRIQELPVSACFHAGVTTVVGLLGTDSSSKSIAQLLAAVKGLNGSGLTAFCLTGSYRYPSVTLTGSVESDIVFISEILGVKIAIADHRSSYPDAQDLIRLASCARRAGLLGGKPGMVTLHLGDNHDGIPLILQAVAQSHIPITQFHPTHCGHDPEGAVLFANQGGVIDFTTAADPYKAAAHVATMLDNHIPLERITLSSDANGSLPQWNEDGSLRSYSIASMDSLLGTVISLVQDFHLPLEEALKPVTTSVAAVLGLADRKGMIKTGYDADLVLLDEDFSIKMVIARGNR